ncbi:MAG: hypothetical protein IJP92_00775 [Lachnospiraceae bacterium]|nr:hypothetical protein [Lachnospiraceae bacterium]
MNDLATVEKPSVINYNDTVYDFSPESVKRIRGMSEEEYQRERANLDGNMYFLVDIIRNG